MSYITRTDKATEQMTPPEGKRKVFISYKHSDEAALPLCGRLAEYILEKHDVAIWYDRQLMAGDEYDEEICRVIKQADAFVLLLTPTALASKYITEREIPYAKENQVAIIPLVAGMAEEELPLAEEIIGRIHMPVWFFGQRSTVPAFPSDALNQFAGGLMLSIANKNLLDKVTLFYERGNHTVSMRYLTPDQVFMKAYGCLFGVGAEADKSLGIKLMESILGSYGDDEEFVELQKQVAYELLSHFYRANKPELFFTCIKPLLAKGFDNLFPLLFDVYMYQWHTELLCRETELSFALFKHLYKTNFGEEWDSAHFADIIEKQEPWKADEAAFAALPHIGELECGAYTAYFRKSESEERTAELILGGKRVQVYDVYAGYGDVYLLFMAYNAEHRLLLTLHSDFDHYGPETLLRGGVYRVDEDGIRACAFASDWLRGLRRLPYNPHTFNIK
ncbi:MAG: toll/interleukin-1 receptor domain-containing protein [Clostridia bacterium]|nr:toll/interleukin-1 receptor domain-containing protein [Clostridia bacterium]